MFNLKLENKAGDYLTFNQNSPFTISEIEGLNPPDATINTSQIAMVDGAKFNSAKVNMRTINIAFAIEKQAAKNRIEVYKVLKSKQWIRLYYEGDYRKVYIDGYISNIDVDHFAMKQIVTCSILCPSPFFSDAQNMVNSLLRSIKMFHFPFYSTETPMITFGKVYNEIGVSIENNGDVETGIIIILYARSAVSNPKIYDYVKRKYFGLKINMVAGDQITIDTRLGEKTVTLLRNGVKTNIFNSITNGSEWLQLDAHGSTYVHEVETGNASNVDLKIKHNNLYEGV